uniref:BZIP domain-containing protein n=1 Tax=Panagrolaimus superbus TaxID=310955 RepID=A0A914XVC6_9BILA
MSIFEDQICYGMSSHPHSSFTSTLHHSHSHSHYQPSTQQQQQHFLNIPNNNIPFNDGSFNFTDTFSNGNYGISAPASWSSTNVSPSQSPTRSSASSPHPYCDVRRGRPLINDNEEESEKIKQKRNYARFYREKVRAEKSKIMDENKQLKSIIQRTLYLYTLPPQTIETEIQKIQNEFNALNNSGITSPTPSHNPFTYPSSTPPTTTAPQHIKHTIIVDMKIPLLTPLTTTVLIIVIQI